MKIAIASSGLSHITRGMEGWSQDIARGLHEKGVDVTLFKGSGNIENSYEKILPTLRRNRYPAQILGRITALGGWRIGLGSAPAVESFIFGTQLLLHLQKGYELLHVKQASLAAFLLKAKKRGLIRIPIVLSNGQIANESFLSQFDYVQHLTPCLERIECSDIDLEHIPQNRFVIPNFIDTELFSPQDKLSSRDHLGLPRDALIILTVGVIRKYHKRMDFFIEEMAQLKQITKLPVHFVVAGARDQGTEEILSMARKMLGESITFMFDVPRKKMPLIYSASDVFILCSLLEAFGTVLIEAISCNVPVICHDHPSFRWIVQGVGKNIDMNMRGALTKSLLDSLDDGALLLPDLRNGRRRVMEEFSKDVVISKMIHMYRQILQGQ